MTVIVRILGEGQYRVSEDAAARLTELDKDLEAAVEAGDERRVHGRAGRLGGRCQAGGSPVPADDFIRRRTSCRRRTRTWPRCSSCSGTTIAGDAIGLQ